MLQVFPLLILVSFVPMGIVLIDYRLSLVSAKTLPILQGIGLASFFLFFGGYSVDAWRYLTRFTHDPMSFGEEWIFWLLGNFLSNNLPDPWPIQFLSAFAVAMWVGAVFRASGCSDKKITILALAILPVVPAFCFAMGNVIRQGLAMTILLHAALYLVEGKKGRFGLLSVIGILVHQVSITLAIAIWLMKLPMRIIWIVLLVSPFVSFLVSFVLSQMGVDLADYIRYSTYDEGQFHYLKFFVYFACACSLLVISSTIDLPIYCRYLIRVFAISVSGASLLLKYEVPFERLLLSSDIFLPIILASVLVGFRPFLRQVFFAGALISSTLFWSSSTAHLTLTIGKEVATQERIKNYQIP